MLPFVVCDHCDVVATTAVFFVPNIVPLPCPSTKSREVLLALLSSILSQHSTTAQNHTLCEIVTHCLGTKLHDPDSGLHQK